MQKPELCPYDPTSNFLSILNLGGFLPPLKDLLPASRGLESDMDNLLNDQSTIVNDYKQATVRLFKEIEQALERVE